MLRRRIDIRPSPTLAIVLCVIHMAAAGAIWFAALPLGLTTALTAAIAAGLVWSLLRGAALRGPEAIIALEINGAGLVSFLTRAGKWRSCALLGTSYVSPRLTILNLRPAGERFVRHVALLPDNVDAQDFRRLR